MAWQSKRKFKRTWGSRRPTVGALAKRVDRKLNKRFQWVPLADQVCGQTLGPCKGCCEGEDETTVRGCEFDDQGALLEPSPSPQAVVLIPPAGDADTFADGIYAPDTLTVVKMVGRIEICPVFCDSANKTTACDSAPDNCQIYQAFQDNFRTYHMRAGLDKSKWEWDPLTSTYVTPSRYPLVTEEWSDAQFLRQWERSKGHAGMSSGIILTGDAQQGCCGDVTAAGAGAPANTLSNGSGTVNIPAISTDCNPCNGEAGQHLGSTTVAHDMQCFNLSLNSRRRLTFRENEGLTFWFDYTSFDKANGLPDWRPNVAFMWRLWAKALLEVA